MKAVLYMWFSGLNEHCRSCCTAELLREEGGKKHFNISIVFFCFKFLLYVSICFLLNTIT